jgi:hypothetical protein
LDRQAKDLDQQARELAELIAPAVKALFVENPELELDNQRVQGLPGVRMPFGFKVEVVRGANRADNWEIRVWHPEGTRFFMVNSQGIQQKYL